MAPVVAHVRPPTPKRAPPKVRVARPVQAPATPAAAPTPRPKTGPAAPALPPAFQPIRTIAEPPAREPVERAMAPVLRYGLPVGIFALAFLLLYAHVDYPSSIVFDEAHYVQYSRQIANGELLTARGNLTDLPINPEHPPLAKQLLAWSLRLYDAGQLDLTWKQYFEGCGAEAGCAPERTWEGCNHDNDACEREARAWRTPSVLVGALGIVGAYLLALRLFNSLPAGLFAAFLLCADTLWYLQSRMALLDIFAAGFGILALGSALGPTRGHRVASAVLMGLAVGSKLPAIFLLPPYLVLLYVSSRTRTFGLRLGGTLAIGLAVTLGAYVATYGPYLGLWVSGGGGGYALKQFLITQGYAVTQDYGFEFEHAYSSAPWTWIPHIRPTFYYWPSFPDYHPPLMYAVGNLALWWPGTLAAVAAPFVIIGRWIRTTAADYATWDALQALGHQPWRLDTTRAMTLAVAAAFFSWAPWFILQRTSFNYYATLNVPFFAVLVAGILHVLWVRSMRTRVLAVAWLAAAGVFYGLAWPVASGAPVHEALWDIGWSLYPVSWDP